MMATGSSADAVLDVLDKKLDAGMISEEEHAHMRVRKAQPPSAALTPAHAISKLC